MRKIVELLIYDFQNCKPSHAYRQLQEKFCEIEKLLSASLTDEQKKLCSKLETLNAELNLAERDFFAEYLFVQIRKIFIGGGV